MDERDRFSTRRRLPRRALLARPRGASTFLLSDVEGDASCLAVCRAALGGDGDARYGDATVTIRRTARVVKDALSARLEAQDGDPWVWITDDRVRRAVAVTLQLERRERGEDSEILKDRAFRQLLLDTIQQRIAVSPGARVKLPAYKAKGDGEVSEWKVVSTYPASDFSVVTTATRVTLTLPDDEAVVDGDLNAKEDYSIKMKYARNEENAPRIGGLERERAALREMILMPLAASGQHVRETYGVEFPKGLLLCGPPGVGKTLLVRSVVHECQQRQDVDLHLDVINGAEIMTAGIGDAESALRDIFQRARDHLADSSGASSAASVIFIDELDALCPKRDDRGSSGASHSRVVAQLLTLMDGVDKTTSNNGANDTVVVVGATNLPNAIDPALRRPGRFDRELFVPPPDTAQRRRIFEMHTAEMPIGVYGTSNSDDVHSRSAVLDELAGKAIGYVGADIAALCREALAVASTRHFVEVVRDRELAAWWEDVKRRGQSVLESIESLSAGGVAGRAWSANPVAIPLWFLAKHKTDNARAVASGGDYFSFLLGSACDKGDIATPSQDTEAIKSNRNIDDNAKDSERPFQVTMEDFDQAMTVVVASTLRGTSGFMKGVDSRGWDSIGGQDETKLALQQALEWPLKFPQTFTRMGIQPPRGVLLYGPPGCSKSSIVRAAAHASGATFLSLPAAAVFSPYFGDAEAAIRQVFRDARRALPAIIFFDEIDVLVAKRSFDGGDSGEDSSSSTAMRILSTLLNEMDGVESADGLLVIGATNVPERIDAALLRPGRFDRVLFVDLPSETDRLAILEIHARGMPLSSDVNLNEIARDSPYCSGAELENICREAALLALRESIDAEFVAMRHFREALSGVRPVSSPESMIRYRAFAEAMGHLK